MRININLASQKYEDAGEFYARWGTALGLVLLVTLGLLFLGWHYYQLTAGARKRVDQLHERIARLDQERVRNEAVLNRPENQDVRDQSRFWNDVIDQKSFSWTRLLSDLEKIMPKRAYLESVQPTITTDKRLQLRLMIAGEKLDDAVDLVKKMEHSEHFRGTYIGQETPPHSTTAGSAPISEFEVFTYYAPAGSPQQRTAGNPGSTKSGNASVKEAESGVSQGAS
jgi:Tfp pilus assembly protein PilN